MISNAYRSIFIHIPKTGGTSVSRAIIKHLKDTSSQEERVNWKKIWKVSSKHDPVRHLEKSNPPLFEKYFKFAFVRNPWDLTFSLYNYLWRAKAGWPKRWRAKNWKIGNAENDFRIACVTKEHLEWSFEEWIKSELFLISSPSAHWCKECNQNQLDWLLNKDGEVGVDFVGRFENLQEDFNYACDKMNIPQLQLPHINRGPKHQHYSKYYNDQTREIVAKKYKRDIEHFNYEFKNDT